MTTIRVEMPYSVRHESHAAAATYSRRTKEIGRWTHSYFATKEEALVFVRGKAKRVKYTPGVAWRTENI
jgi:hypothetical protein